MTTQTVPIIKLRMLRGACPEQREIFEAEWPSGAEATLENVLRAVELGLDLEWGRRLFSPTARAEYERQIAFALVRRLRSLRPPIRGHHTPSREDTMNINEQVTRRLVSRQPRLFDCPIVGLYRVSVDSGSATIHRPGRTR
jgi:hypothetical protein